LSITTIGYEGHTVDDIIDMLRAADVKTFVDVRLRRSPASQVCRRKALRRGCATPESTTYICVSLAIHATTATPFGAAKRTPWSGIEPC
jgi:hypothetical protein